MIEHRRPTLWSAPSQIERRSQAGRRRLRRRALIFRLGVRAALMGHLDSRSTKPSSTLNNRRRRPSGTHRSRTCPTKQRSSLSGSRTRVLFCGLCRVEQVLTTTFLLLSQSTCCLTRPRIHDHCCDPCRPLKRETKIQLRIST